MNVLVTGAGGFLGRYVVNALLSAGHDVRALDRMPLQPLPGMECITADLVDQTDLTAAFDGMDVLVHLAAALGGDPRQVVRGTVEGTRNLLMAMSRSATRRLVLASSFAVYNREMAGDVITEQSPIHDAASVRACDAYAQAKIQQEGLTREFARQQDWVLTVLRPAVIWGREKPGAFLLGRRIGPLQLVVAPSSLARLIYVENAADAFVKAAERTTVPGEQVVNLVDDPAVTIRQFAAALHPRTGGLPVPLPYAAGLSLARLAAFLSRGSARLPYFLQPARFAAMHRPMTFSNQRLRDLLGWTPRYSFEQAAARAAMPAKDAE